MVRARARARARGVLITKCWGSSPLLKFLFFFFIVLVISAFDFFYFQYVSQSAQRHVTRNYGHAPN